MGKYLFSKVKVTLKAAITLDGKIATENGDSKWITSNESRMKAHYLRMKNDAILVGIGTILKDDPYLNVRNIKTEYSPIRIILDSKGKLPIQSNVLIDDGIKIIHVTGSETNKLLNFNRKNILTLRSETKIPKIPWLLEQLFLNGIKSVLVEGGRKINSSFIKNGFVNELHLFLAPKLIGSNKAYSWCNELGIKYIKDSLNFEFTSILPSGNDLHIIAKPSNKIN